MEFISLAISIIGFLITIGTISRKMVTKDDIKTLIDKINDISDRVVELEKKTTLLEYRLSQIETKS